MQSHRVVLGRVARRRVVPDREGRPRRELVGLGGALFLFLARLGDVGLRRKLGGDGIGAKYFSIQAFVCGRLEVADDDQHRVVRRVEGLEEVRDVLERGGVEVLQVAVEVVGVVPVRVGVLRQVEPGESAVGPVQDVDLDLVLDDFLLVLEVVGRDREALHAVGLGPERGLERVRGDDLEVVGEVEAGRAVEDAAVGLDELDELHLPEVLRALEHHVLEEVGEAGAVLGLDAEADVVVDRDDGHGSRRVPREDDLQSVGQLRVVDRDLEGRRACGKGESGGRGERAGTGENRRGGADPRARNDFMSSSSAPTAELYVGKRGRFLSARKRALVRPPRVPSGRLAPRSAPPDRLGAPGALAPAGGASARGPRDPGRRRPGRRPRRRPGGNAPGHRAPRSRGQLLLGLRAGPSSRDPPARLARRGDELSLVRPRPRRPRADAAEPPPAPLSLRRDRGPRLPRPHARRARPRGPPLRGRGLARRQRAAQVARGDAPGPSDRGGGRDLDALRSRGERPAPRHGARARSTRPDSSRRSRERPSRSVPAFRSPPGGSTCPGPSPPARSGSSTTPPTRRSTGSTAPTTTIAGRAPSGTCRGSRRRRSASPPRTIHFFRARRSSARGGPPRGPSSSSSLHAVATSASSPGGRRGDARYWAEGVRDRLARPGPGRGALKEKPGAPCPRLAIWRRSPTKPW